MTQLGSAQAQLLRMMNGGRVPLQPPSAIDRVPAGTRVPLSAAQAGIWFFSRLYPDSAEYNVFSGFEFALLPERERVTEAVRTLMRRHDVLRIRVLEVDGVPVQEACDGLEPPVQWHDLRDEPPAEAREHGREIMERIAARPIPTDEAPLFWVVVVALPGRAGLMAVGYHHLITDHVSDTQLSAELRALLASEPLPPPPSVGFLDYLVAQTGKVSETRQRREIEYWRAKLGGQPAAVHLPADRARPAEPSRRGRLVRFTVPGALRAKLAEFAAREDTTLHTVLLAGYKVLLARLTRQADVTVGAPLVGRDYLAERIVGCFIRPVALRTDLSGRASFRDVVHRVQETVLDAQDHQSVDFERIVAELGITREQGVNPVFQTIFGFQDAPSPGGAGIAPITLENGSARADLTVSITQAGDALQGVLEYACDLFDEATIAAYARMYLHLLGRAVTEPHRVIDELGLVPERELEWLTAFLDARVVSSDASARPGPAADPLADGGDTDGRDPDGPNPAGEVELRLTEIFRQVLDVDQMDATDGFFELGGHSLLAFKIIDACDREFGVKPSVADFFAASSPRELAGLIDAGSHDAAPRLVPYGADRGLPVIVFIHGVDGRSEALREIARRLEPDFDVYGLRSAASSYKAEVDRVRGSRPVVLVSWSVDGRVALELPMRDEVVRREIPGSHPSPLAGEHAADLASAITAAVEEQLDCGEI